MNAIYLGMYFLSVMLVCTVLVLAIKRSAFGVLLLMALIWFLIGSCIYPIFDLFGIVERGVEVQDFISRNGEPGLATALHVLLASIGMACGYMYRPRKGIGDSVVGAVTSKLIGANDSFVWRVSILLGIACYLVYFQLVGFDVALINAAAARGGDFEGFGEKDSYLFIKTVAAIGLVATSFLPMMLLAKKDRIFILLYGLLIVMAYSNSISRNLVLYGAIVPVLVYVRLKWDMTKRSARYSALIVASVLIPFALLVLNYGKVMGHYISFYLSGDDYSMTSEVGDVSVIDSILNNFGFQWVSVQAGIDHFFRTGLPLVTQEQFLAAFFGAIPSRVLSFFGADFLYYGTVTTKLACINSGAFGYQECTVPPLAIGYAAYLLPGAGGFLVGFVWLRFYVAIERVWLSIQASDYRKLWIPYFLWAAVVNFFTFIPSALALTMTQLLWLIVMSRLRIKPAKNKSKAVARGVLKFKPVKAHRAARGELP
ncbi:MAG TPA: hypothetical protein VFF81_03765 [Noviherbaspirillum sp.]|nr:hypothetical protein [Noviherbaspirillum sp.]